MRDFKGRTRRKGEGGLVVKAGVLIFGGNED